MNPFTLFALSLAVAMGLNACGKSEELAEEAAAPPAPAVEAPKTDVDKALSEAREKGREAAEAAAVAASKVTESAREKGGEIAEAARNQGAEAAASANAKAEEMIANLKASIESKNADLAKQTIAQLQMIKGSLSESMQARIEQLEAMQAGAEGAAAPPQGQ